MSLYFADNQSKQAAFDRTYNARARSDYAQGRKLQALIKKENIDDALTDQLASLYANTLRKAGEYEYDRISRALKKSAPTVVAPETTKATKKAKSGRTRVYKETEMQTETKEPLEEKPEIPAKDEIEAKPPTKTKSVKSPPNTTALAVIDSFEVPIYKDEAGKELGRYDVVNAENNAPLAQEDLRDYVWEQLHNQFKRGITKEKFQEALPFIDNSEENDKNNYLLFKSKLRAWVNDNSKKQPASPAKKPRSKKAPPITPEASTARA